MTSEQDIELLESFLDGELEESQKAQVAARLEAEADLQAQLAQLKSDRALRMQLWQSYEPAEPAVDGMLAAIRAKQQRRAWYVRLLDHREQIAAAAACIAVFLIGWQWARESNSFHMSPGAMPSAQPVRLITQQQGPAGFEVRVTDETGKLIRQERFQTLDQAKQFVEQTQKELAKRNSQ